MKKIISILLLLSAVTLQAQVQEKLEASETIFKTQQILNPKLRSHSSEYFTQDEVKKILGDEYLAFKQAVEVFATTDLIKSIVYGTKESANTKVVELKYGHRFAELATYVKLPTNTKTIINNNGKTTITTDRYILVSYSERMEEVGR